MTDLKRIASLAFSAIIAVAATAATVDIPANEDATLYEDATGSLANGAGEHFFAGRTSSGGGGKIRRGLIAFNVAAAVPAGCTISDATLKLTMTRTISGAATVSIHAVTADWGQGASNAAAQEGTGIAAAPNDATWTKRFFNTTSDWTAAGGDFNAISSATTSVDGLGLYTWTSATTLSNVQGWYANPAANFGWLVRGDETVIATAKRFSTTESPIAGNRPVLTVIYTPPSGITEWSLY